MLKFKVCISLTFSVMIIDPVKTTNSVKILELFDLTLLIFSLFLPSSLLPDLLNGAQEKCELPPLEGFPHCEGKLKVSHTHTL